MADMADKDSFNDTAASSTVTNNNFTYDPVSASYLDVNTVVKATLWSTALSLQKMLPVFVCAECQQNPVPWLFLLFVMAFLSCVIYKHSQAVYHS